MDLRNKIIMSAFFIAFFFFSTSCVSKTDKPSEAYLFMKDVILVAGDIASSVDRFKTREEEIKNKNEIDLITQMMKDFHTASYDIKRAQVSLESYSYSKNKIIKESSFILSLALISLALNYQETIEFLEMAYSAKSIQNPDMGKIMGGMAQLSADRDEILKKCMEAAIMTTYSLVSDKKDREGHLSSLTISSSERRSLIKSLENTFGEKIEGGLKSGLSLSMSPAAGIYEFLKSDFTPSDK